MLASCRRRRGAHRCPSWVGGGQKCPPDKGQGCLWTTPSICYPLTHTLFPIGTSGTRVLHKIRFRTGKILRSHLPPPPHFSEWKTEALRNDYLGRVRARRALGRHQVHTHHEEWGETWCSGKSVISEVKRPGLNLDSHYLII